MINLNTPAYTSKVLTVSTCHVSFATGMALDRAAHERPESLPELLCQELDSGWLVNLGNVTPELQFPGHTELAELVKFASSMGYAYLLLDSDGSPLPVELEFAVFEW